MARPQGMIDAEEFAIKSGESIDSVIKNIEDGVYIGKESGGRWYLERPARLGGNLNEDSQEIINNAAVIPKSAYSSAKRLSKAMIFIGWLCVILSLLYILLQFGHIEPMFAGVVSLVFGLLLIQASQVVLAITDSADNIKLILDSVSKGGTL